MTPTLAWSASATSRILACPASAALPRVDTPVGKAADDGTEIHQYLENVVRFGRASALERLGPSNELRSRCERIDLGPLLIDAESCEAEQAIAYDPQTETTVKLPPSGQRGYHGVPEGSIPGTIDLLVRDHAGGLWVWDYKTGREPVSAKNNGQLGFFAVAFARLHGVDDVHVGIVQIDEAGAFTPDVVHFDAWALDAYAAKLRKAHTAALRAAERIEAGLVPDTAIGDHCAWCPALRHCPSHYALARELAGLEILNDYTPEAAGALYVKLSHYEKILTIVKASLRTMAEAGPLPAPGGKVVATSTESRDVIRAAQALPILREHLTEEQFSRVAEVKITKAAIQRELEPPDARVLLEALRDADAYAKISYPVVRIRNQKDTAP